MMQVKKYRAATTREALEQIKQDLGEDAFVLETRRVKSGGFLGLGSQMQIEISAANPSQLMKPALENKSQRTPSRLDLKDETIAAPQISEQVKNQVTSFLPHRQQVEEPKEKSNPKYPKSYASVLGLEDAEIETVEISTEMPRIIHTKKEFAQSVSASAVAAASAKVETVVSASTAAIPAMAENPTSLITNREMDLLRAELREVKFSLGTFTQRHTAPVNNNNVDLEMFGEVFDTPYYEAYLRLNYVGFSPELSSKLIASVIPAHKNGLIGQNEIPHAAVLQNAEKFINFEPALLEQNKPGVLAVIGATGVGKTTTIAKIAARVALRERRRVELVTLDTYRIAAVEQLKTYAEIIGANCHVVRSVFELDAVLRRLPEDATVLIDTTGKNPYDLADQYELADYLRGREEIRKCLAIQATINLHDGLSAIKKFEIYGADCLALTKLDETTRPGAMFELVTESHLPLSYLCAGQRVPEDFQPATAESFASRILREQL